MFFFVAFFTATAYFYNNNDFLMSVFVPTLRQPKSLRENDRLLKLNLNVSMKTLLNFSPALK